MTTRSSTPIITAAIPNNIDPSVMTTNHTNSQPTFRQQTLPFVPPHYTQTVVNVGTPQEISPTTQQILLPQQTILNEPWGDSIYHKPKHSFRIYFQNINGIQPSKPERWQHIVQTIFETYNTDIGGLCETGINWKNPTLKNKLQTSSKTILKTQINLQHSRNNAHSPATNFLPGGTLHITKGNWIGRSVSHLVDPQSMGRWSGTRYRTKSDHSLYVLTAYRPCPSPHHSLAQSNSTYAQQYFMIQDTGESSPDPRAQFITDLTQYIQSWKLTPQDKVILMLDANERLGGEKEGITRLLADTGLTDIFSLNKASTCTIATHNKGTHRIDFMFGTINLLPYVHQCGYTAFHQDIISDHRGIFLDISTALLDDKILLQGPKPRSVGSHIRFKQTILYKKYIVNHFEEHNIEERSVSMLNMPYNTPEQKVKYTNTLNRLDKQVSEIILSAEKKFGSDPLKKLMRNNEIAQYQQIVRYWHTCISGLKTKQDMTPILTQIYAIIDPEMQPHITDFITRPQTGLKKAQTMLKEAKARSILKLKYEEELEHAMIADADNVSTTRISDNRARAKYTKQLYGQLRSRFKQQHSGGLSHILVPDETDTQSNTMKLITNPKEVESHILK